MKKIFVLDTSVIVFDHQSITSFEEHDVIIPITILEELDNFKKGSDSKNYEVRSFIRFLDNFSTDYDTLADWIPIPGEGKGEFKVMMNINGLERNPATEVYSSNSMDNKILNIALSVQDEYKERPVILVTKDVNLRLKAKALGLRAEDFETGKVKDKDLFHQSIIKMDDFSQQVIDSLYSSHSVDESVVADKIDLGNNHYYILQGNKSSALAYYSPFRKSLERVNKSSCFGIKPKNAEQAFALHALLEDEIKLCAIHGVAGTGKTLLSLAAAIEQKKKYKQIYLARPIVPLSNKDIGYLPGDMKAKVDPYMQPLWDNLKIIQYQFDESDKEYKQISLMVEQEKLLISPLAYIRGRSLSDVIFIVDEAQNLTPHEVKTIITRAGENAKFIFTGDVRQIDTPYLDEESNGLSYLIDRFKGQKIFSHIRLEKGERSELANLANELL